MSDALAKTIDEKLVTGLTSRSGHKGERTNMKNIVIKLASSILFPSHASPNLRVHLFLFASSASALTTPLLPLSPYFSPRPAESAISLQPHIPALPSRARCCSYRKGMPCRSAVIYLGCERLMSGGGTRCGRRVKKRRLSSHRAWI